MAYHYNSHIVTDELVLCLDAGDNTSWSGATWKDLSGNSNDGTLTSSSMGFSDSGYNLAYAVNNTTEDAISLNVNQNPTALDNGQVVQIESEQMLVGAFRNYFGSSTSFYVTRGHNSTTAAAHSSGLDILEAGSEITFDGNGQLADVGDIGDVFGTNFTVDLWIYPTETDDRQEFIGQKVNNDNWWRFGIDELDNWEIDVEVGDSRVVSLNPDFNLTESAWQHVVLSRDRSTWNFYLNGALDATASDEDTIPDMAANVRIGKAVDGPYEGKMAVVKVYDRSLSAAEVLQNFNAHRGRFGI
jgi:hypothetical protein